jgi:hypothetical protein
MGTFSLSRCTRDISILSPAANPSAPHHCADGDHNNIADIFAAKKNTKRKSRVASHQIPDSHSKKILLQVLGGWWVASQLTTRSLPLLSKEGESKEAVSTLDFDSPACCLIGLGTKTLAVG